MIYELICEGVCNPTIDDIDSAIRQSLGVDTVLRKRDLDGKGARSVPYLWDLQRSLRYTPHVMVTVAHAECLVCHTVRRYGSGPVGVGEWIGSAGSEA